MCLGVVVTFFFFLNVIYLEIGFLLYIALAVLKLNRNLPAGNEGLHHHALLIHLFLVCLYHRLADWLEVVLLWEEHQIGMARLVVSSGSLSTSC